MNFYEAEVAKCDRRIRRIEGNPDPAMLKTNKMRYELERDRMIHKVQAWREGKPFADGPARPLLMALGFELMDLYGSADRTGLAERHFETVRRMALPEIACDRTVVGIAMCVNGELPPPSLMLVSNRACDPDMLSCNALGRWFNAAVYCVDTPLKADGGALKYVAGQLGELIEFAQGEVTGIRFDESRLLELQEYDRKAFEYMHDIYELRKRVPCPISGKDAFRLPTPPSHYPDPAKALEYFRAWRDEMGERAEEGIGAVKDEKLRLMWMVSGPFFADPFEVLERRGASIPWFQFDMAQRWSLAGLGNYGDEKEYGRKLSPLEEEARMMLYQTWGSVADRWIDNTIYVCRDLKIDGLINFKQVGCTATVNLARILEERAEAEIGIPTLHLDGRQLDRSRTDPDLEAKLNAFVDKCLTKKGLA